MIITTTPSVEGKTIKRYLGVIAGEAIMGANIFRDIFANIRDIVGGRSAAYERELERARQAALADLEERGRALGAEAVVGVSVHYEVIGNSMLMVSVTGTAVVVQ